MSNSPYPSNLSLHWLTLNEWAIENFVINHEIHIKRLGQQLRRTRGLNTYQCMMRVVDFSQPRWCKPELIRSQWPKLGDGKAKEWSWRCTRGRVIRMRPSIALLAQNWHSPSLPPVKAQRNQIFRGISSIISRGAFNHSATSPRRWTPNISLGLQAPFLFLQISWERGTHGCLISGNLQSNYTEKQLHNAKWRLSSICRHMRFNLVAIREFQNSYRRMFGIVGKVKFNSIWIQCFSIVEI